MPDIDKEIWRDIWLLLAATSITINIIHLGSYYMAYILLAFIYNPIQTATIYLGLTFCILCGYLFFWALMRISASQKKYGTDANNETDASYKTDKYNLCSNDCKHLNNTIIGWFIIGLPFAVVYFSFLIVYALTLGSFDDFGVIQNFVPPLLIGLLTYFVVKPAYKEAIQWFNPVSDDQIAKFFKEDVESTQHVRKSIKETPGTIKH